jgi:uncharacterized membrane protein
MLGALACMVLAYVAYTRTGLHLPAWQRGILVALRAVTLAALAICLLRPVATAPPRPGAQGILALVVDSSRSMAISDADGGQRLESARRLARALTADLGREFRVDVFAAGERLERTTLDRLSATARRSDLDGAVTTVRERYADAPLAGILLVSDGGETSPPASDSAAGEAVPVYTIGVGSPVAGRDREVRSVTAAPSALDASLVDLTVTLVAHGDRRVPLRLLQGTRVVDLRDVDVPADGSPVQQAFTVPVDRTAPAVFKVEVPAVAGELTAGNNVAEVLVPPPGRPRRVLMIEGQPGFEHSFLKRAWHEDPSVTLDAVVRKGRNDGGQDTYYVQAAPGRTAALTSGFPTSRAALFGYDGLVLANLEPDALTRDQQALVADFVGERGGGLLVLGSRALSAPLSSGSPLSPVLPLDLADRRGLARVAGSSDSRYTVALTDEGVRHPLMRLDATGSQVRQRWAALPALAGAAASGGPRPGASVLALTTAATGAVVPLVTVQRFGAGRSMIFGGEASWHWKMMVPARETAYDVFWRQSLRWLTAEAPDPVALAVPPVVAPGTTVPIDVTARDDAFAPVTRPSVTLTLRSGDGARDLAARPGTDGHAVSTWLADRPGLYEIAAEARDGDRVLGAASRYVLVGGIDPELTDPRLNDVTLRRIAAHGGGAYVRAADASSLASRVREARASARREMRDLWHNAWSLAGIVALLAAEWGLRRRWGLR